MFLKIILESVVEIIVALMYASICEWLLHRYVMHKPLWKFRYPYKAHALTHHRIFGYDETYHLINENDKKTITMAWWNGPVIVFLTAIIPVTASLLFGIKSVIFVFVPVSIMYYGVYEYIHFCMHLPKQQRRIIERNWFFYRLNGHHLLHHRYMGKNFNVVFPFADLVFGTLILRSKIIFKQPQGISIPNVQPF